MVRYWVIAPYDSTEPKIFDKVWEYDLQKGTIALGWKKLGDISNITSKDDLRKKYKKIYPDVKNISSISRDCNAMWNFYNEISPGDIIIARRGRKKIVGIGAVREPKNVYYNKDQGDERVGNLSDNIYPNFIEVNWEKKDIEFEKIVFGIYTIDELTEEKYKYLEQQKIPAETEEETEVQTEEEKAELYMEKYLREIIVSNFDLLFKRQLKLYIDNEGNTGELYPITGTNGKKIGEIDILATEPKTNSYIVIELKKGRESSKVVGQVLAYMGWVKDNLCKGEQRVKGTIICKEENEKLTNALKLVSNMIDLKFYKLNLELVNLEGK